MGKTFFCQPEFPRVLKEWLENKMPMIQEYKFLLSFYNLGENIVDKFTKVSKPIYGATLKNFNFRLLGGHSTLILRISRVFLIFF